MDRYRVEALLGDDFFKGLRQFYKEIRESSCDYKVCLVRRCYVLGEIFYHIVEEAKPPYDNPCITDSALLSLCPQIVQFFMQKKRFPDILIADDILIHGRAVNAFLVRLEDELIRLLRESGCQLEDDWIRTELAYAVNVRVYIKSSKLSMLLLRYLTSVKCVRVEEDVVWRNLSNRISVLISESAFANANYVLSVLVGKTKKKKLESFRKVKTFYRGTRQTAYIRVLDFGDGPKAILTVRAFNVSKNKTTRMIPFVFMSSIRARARSWLLALIQERLHATGFRIFSILQWEGMHRICNEFISLVLSQNVLFWFEREYGKIILPYALDDELEISKISRNYGGTSLVSSLIRFVKRYALFNEWELEAVICRVTAESEPLFGYDAGWLQESQQKRLRDLMEQVIYEKGMEAEKEAYLLSNQKYFNTSRLYRESKTDIGGFFKEISEKAGKDFSIDYAAAYTLQFMDAGMMVLSVYKSCAADAEAYCQYCKAGEQSLMIGPLRLHLYIPLLIIMNARCKAAGLEFEEELRKFNDRCPLPDGDCDRILKYMDGLKNTGQTINDWDFNMLIRIYTDYDEKTKKALKNPYERILRDLEIIDKRNEYALKYIGG